MKLSEKEWQFLDVPEAEWWACEAYEYCRDVPGIEEAKLELSDWRARQGADDVLSTVPLRALACRHPVADTLIGLMLLQVEGFPHRPWKDLEVGARTELAGKIPSRDIALREEYDYLLKMLGDPPFLLPADACGRITEETAGKWFNDVGLRVFSISTGRRTKRSLMKGFEMWLEANPHVCSDTQGGGAKEGREPIAWLRCLAVRRLKRAGVNSSVRSVIDAVAEYGNGWLNHSEQRWSDWEKEALARRKELFGV